jgi:hypothetical protein
MIVVDGRRFRFTTALEKLLDDQEAEMRPPKKENTIVALEFHRKGKPIRDFRGGWEPSLKYGGQPSRGLSTVAHTACASVSRGLPGAGVSRAITLAPRPSFHRL